jgi:hypothetical protein
MQFVCDKTGTVVEAKRLPPGWKRIGQRLLSTRAVREEFTQICISVPIRWSADKTENDQLNERLNRGFALSTALANWFMTELYVRDCRRLPGMEKLPKMNAASLYQAAKERFPLHDTPAGLLAAMEHRIRGIYGKKRFAILWTGRQALPSFRYPFPYPCRSQDWSLRREGDRWFVSLNIARDRFEVELSQSHKYNRQRDCLSEIAAGDGKFGELLVVRNKRGVFLRISATIRRRSKSALSGTLFVRSDSDSLLVALNEKDQRLWIYHGDQLRRWSAEHRRRLNRWADDSKFEDRPVPGLSARRRAAAEKYRNRMNTACQQIAARVAGYARRRRFAIIELDLSDQTFCTGFPWSDLKTKICQAAALDSIQVNMPAKEE